jgi:hypothetical protein
MPDQPLMHAVKYTKPPVPESLVRGWSDCQRQQWQDLDQSAGKDQNSLNLSMCYVASPTAKPIDVGPQAIADTLIAVRGGSYLHLMATKPCQRWQTPWAMAMGPFPVQSRHLQTSLGGLGLDAIRPEASGGMGMASSTSLNTTTSFGLSLLPPYCWDHPPASVFGSATCAPCGCSACRAHQQGPWRASQGCLQ